MIRLGPATEPPARLAFSGETVDLFGAAPVSPPLLEAIAGLTASGNDWHGLPTFGKTLLLAAVMLARSPAQSTGQAAVLAAAISRLSNASQMPSASSAQARQDLVGAHNASHPAQSPAPADAPPRQAGARSAEYRTVHSAQSEPFTQTTRSGKTRRTRQESLSGSVEIPAERAMDTEAPADSVLPAPALSIASAPAGYGEPASFLAPDARFQTGFGGLLFLLNAFIALGLYPDFTQPLGARLEPSPLWLADRIGRFWFGARYRNDPLAGWIAGNAAPGRLPRTWRPESDWLIGFETKAAPRRALQRSRITLWHPMGFALVDEEQGRSPHRRRLVAGFRRPRLRMSPARLPSKPSDRWAACLALYLDARLRLLCGGGLSLLALPARIQTRDLDLSATFALDRHPIQLRIAGLDRDPGWQPAEGRTIAFVFE
jgi:hypothetical protein